MFFQRSHLAGVLLPILAREVVLEVGLDQPLGTLSPLLERAGGGAAYSWLRDGESMWIPWQLVKHVKQRKYMFYMLLEFNLTSTVSFIHVISWYFEFRAAVVHLFPQRILLWCASHAATAVRARRIACGVSEGDQTGPLSVCENLECGKSIKKSRMVVWEVLAIMGSKLWKFCSSLRQTIDISLLNCVFWTGFRLQTSIA